MIRLTFFALVIASFSSMMLSGCGGGAQTEGNPNLGDESSDYRGPAAKTADILSFQNNVWVFLKENNRCGQCHSDSQDPTFVDTSDVNKAYSEVIAYVDLLEPATAGLVTKVGGGHNCWLQSDAACASVIEQMLVNWANDSGVDGGRIIELTAPAIKAPGDTKSFPANQDDTTPSFEDTIYPILIGTSTDPLIDGNNCQGCHAETASPLAIAPFFASEDVDSAYEAVKSKINIDDPSRSRLVIRLRDEFHNCWSDCGDDADDLQDAIQQFAGGVPITEVDDDAVNASMALNLGDGIVASGGNRFENNQIALWEFKTKQDGIAYDTSGIEPAMDLTLIGDSTQVRWLGSYGLEFTGGRAQASTFNSTKLKTFLQATGEYAIEAWVIPDNVTQEDRSIISYSGSGMDRNFSLSQTMYNYEYYNRIDVDPAQEDGGPVLSTVDAGEILQVTLQHVVINYSPITGREIYVNGERINVTDPVVGPTTAAPVWEDDFTFVIGNLTSGANPWMGKVRFASVHSRTLTEEQVQQNYEVGVGEIFFLLFSVAHRTGIDDTYVAMQVSQIDEYGYLFEAPFFINLDSDWTAVPIDIKGMRIAVNGIESSSGQAFASIDTTINTTDYVPGLGQVLSEQGAIIPIDKGIENDEFFLTFETIGGWSRDFTESRPGPADFAADPVETAVSSDIGLRTFEEINASIAEITGIGMDNSVVKGVYDELKQQLPSSEAIGSFVPAHQIAIAQLALASCNELVDADVALGNTSAQFFEDFDFSVGSGSNFTNTGSPTTDRSLVIDPLLEAVMNVDLANATNNLTSQPGQTDVHEQLGTTAILDPDDPANADADDYNSLISQLLINDATNTGARTQEIVKAVCAAAVGSAVMLVQ